MAVSEQQNHRSPCASVRVRQSEEQAKERLWEDHLSEFGRGVHMFRTEKTQRLVATGIPESLRGELWMALSGTVKMGGGCLENSGRVGAGRVRSVSQ